MKVYIYADLLNKYISHTSNDFWRTDEQKETGLYTSEYVAFQLLEVQEIEWKGEFDFVSGKILALEKKLEKDLADSYIRQHNLQDQINELKCLTHQPDIDVPPTPSEDPSFEWVFGDE